MLPCDVSLTLLRAIGSRIFTWKQPELAKNQTSVDKVVADTQKEIIIQKTNRDKIHDIALGLDVYEHAAQKEDDK